MVNILTRVWACGSLKIFQYEDVKLLKLYFHLNLFNERQA